MNRFIWILTILTCILFYFLGKQSVAIPRCEPMKQVEIRILEESKKELPKTGAFNSNNK